MSSAATRAPVAIAPARRCAYAVIRRVFERGAYADRALHAEARGLDRRDRALAMRLAFGTVQRCATLDHLIEQLSGRARERLDDAVLAALRLGMYELAFLGGAPDRAVVADAVELAKAGGRGGHGLVNAVLRRAATEASGLLEELGDDTPRRASVCHSHPLWLTQMWWDALGPEDARALMGADNRPAELALRANTLVNGAAELARALPVATHMDAGLEEAVVVDEAFDAHGSPLWRAGAFMPQSRAAMLVARTVKPAPGERVLDLCAAPGGKTTHLAALMNGAGEVVAVERHAGRAAALERTCGRMRATNVRVRVGDAAATPPEDVQAFDRVLVDPPCSGLGTLQARPDLRWRATPEAIGEMLREQAAILAAGARAVRPDGVLVYSTCTISPAEDENQIAAFLSEHPDFGVDDLGAELPGFAHPQAPRHLLTLPHRHGTAGFFIARLRRNDLLRKGR